MQPKRILQIVRLVMAVIIMTGVIIFKHAKENSLQAGKDDTVQTAAI